MLYGSQNWMMADDRVSSLSSQYRYSGKEATVKIPKGRIDPSMKPSTCAGNKTDVFQDREKFV